eukprot:gb/GEZN01014822.1/.p1 GENE.gb/GEZN01014822.1/~~gb/GEZN01014822.1/.p1  ORF type:complete len:121 (+),score=2.52 gb/GEZN01014822.1/:274-636(+)
MHANKQTLKFDNLPNHFFEVLQGRFLWTRLVKPHGEYFGNHEPESRGYRFCFFFSFFNNHFRVEPRQPKTFFCASFVHCSLPPVLGAVSAAGEGRVLWPSFFFKVMGSTESICPHLSDPT